MQNASRGICNLTTNQLPLSLSLRLFSSPQRRQDTKKHEESWGLDAWSKIQVAYFSTYQPLNVSTYPLRLCVKIILNHIRNIRHIRIGANILTARLT